LTQDAKKRVTVFLTSHKLAEVVEVCDRVAIIGNGQIGALDSPRNLRATHTDLELISITFTAADAMHVEAALRAAFSSQSLTLERGATPDAWLLKFSRKADDEILDSVLRVLHQSGCVIRATESERATLLDVLESYESKQAEKEESA
jgi:ABC-type multidrug transport system ATPase subunit